MAVNSKITVSLDTTVTENQGAGTAIEKLVQNELRNKVRVFVNVAE